MKRNKAKKQRNPILKRNKVKKQIKTDKWNERLRNLEEDKTEEEDREWNKKDDEDEEMGENEDDYHEEIYDT